MKNIETNNLVLGAGVTGLSYINFLKDKNYIILEKENTVGGYCRTNYKDGFVWDFAGHFFHFNNEKIKKFFLEKINKDELIYQKKNTKIYYKNKFINYPFQKNIHQLNKKEFIDCLYDLFNKVEKDNYKNFLEMLHGKFGKAITEKFLKPYNEKLYACSLKELDANSMGRFFPYTNKEEIIKNMKENKNTSYNDKFLYPKRGAYIFIETLLRNIDTEKILLNEEIQEINSKEKYVKTRTYIIKYKNLVNTIPLLDFIKYENINFYSKVKKYFKFNQVLVFNIGLNRKDYRKDIHWIYYSENCYNFYRIGFYNNILKEDKLSIYVEIGFKEDKKIDVEKEFKKTINNLKDVGIINSEDQIVSYENIIMRPAYVHINKESNEYKKIYKEQLEEKDIYTIGRYGDWKYCSIEDSVLDAYNLNLKLEGRN